MFFRKFITIIVSILLLSIVAGCYGILHDVITYKISHEYFTKFKFVQFGLIERGSNLPVNIFQLLVFTGWAATWWVGFIAGCIFGGAAFGLKKAGAMTGAIAKASLIMMGTAVLFGILGYNVGFFTEAPVDLTQLCYDCGTLENPDAFITAGYVHNFSYAGGFIGIILGVVSILKRRHAIAVEAVLKKDK
ncbi:MAG: hypothetical protein ACLGH8_10225 [Bacteroidia bacterium]